MSLELDDETREALGWGTEERTRVVERVFAQRLTNETVRVVEWRAKNPGWWRKEAWRKTEAGKAASRRAGAKYRAKVRLRNAPRWPDCHRPAIIDTKGGSEHG